MTDALKYLYDSVYQLLGAFWFGVGLSFTPCVYPLLPVVVAVVTSNAGGRKLRAFLLALTYALGMAIVYTILGIAAALSGQTIGSWVSNPYLLFVVANVFVLMGLWMMDVFSIPLPGFLTRHRQVGRGGFGSTFFAGLVSAFVIGPCSTPGLLVIVGYITDAAKGAESAAGSVVFGGAMMFFFALGMTVLLIAAATFSGLLTTLPKPGGWMNVVKKCLGAFMILMGEYYIFFMALNTSFSQYPWLKGLLEKIGLNV